MFVTSFSTNAVLVLRAAGIKHIKRLEHSIRYQMQNISWSNREDIIPMICDRMTQCEYPKEVCFEGTNAREKYFEIDLIGSIDNLIAANQKLS